MLSFQTFTSVDASVEQEAIPSPLVTVEEAGDVYGKFTAGPLPKGHGMTLGTPLRRILYASLPGVAVTWVKIEGVLHEYATIPHVKEEVMEFLLNIKGVRLRSGVDRPGKLRLEVAGQGEVCAGDIMASSDFQVVNPELYLATLDSDEARLSVELNVERGTGYSEASRGDGLPIGVLPVDAIYTPVRKVNYRVENVRVGQRTDFERLVIEVWTDGSIGPVEALRQAGNILVGHFFLFANTQKVSEDGDGRPAIHLRISSEQYNIPVERLELSSRTLNCLKRASIDKVGQILEKSKFDLLQIRNFGEKSLAELYGRLRDMDLLPPDLDPEVKPEEGEAEQGASTIEVAQSVAAPLEPNTAGDQS
jgi:DNA-directed RNA polymerase subunit alpha